MTSGAFVLSQQECDERPTHSLITAPFTGHRLATIHIHLPSSPAEHLLTPAAQVSPAQLLPPSQGHHQLCSQEDLSFLPPQCPQLLLCPKLRALREIWALNRGGDFPQRLGVPARVLLLCHAKHWASMVTSLKLETIPRSFDYS